MATKRVLLADIEMQVKALDQASANLVAIATKVDALGASAGKTAKQADAMNGSFLRSLSVVRGMAIRMAALAAASAAVTIGIKGTIGAAIDFETSFAGIRKTVDLSESDFKKLELINRKLATQLPISVNDINAIGQVAGELGVSGVAGVAKFEEVVAKLGATTNLTNQEAGDFLGALLSVTGQPISSVENIGAAVVDLGNKFGGTEKNIADFATRIVGSGTAVGLTTPQILGIAAAFASLNIPAERGGTAVQKVLIAMEKAAVEGGDSLATFATVLGVTGAQFQNLVRNNPAEAFVQLINRLGQAGPTAIAALEALGLTDARLVASFLSAASAGDRVNNTITTSNQAFKDSNALNTEAEKRFKTTASQVQIAKNKFNELGIAIGQTTLPAMVFLARAAGGAAVGLKELSKHADVAKLVVIGLSGAFLGPIAAIGAIIFLIFRWRQVLQQLPGPVQTAVKTIATAFDFLANGLVKTLNTALDAISSFANKIANSKLAKGINFGLNKLGLPTLPSNIDLGQINFKSDVASAIADALTKQPKTAEPTAVDQVLTNLSGADSLDFSGLADDAGKAKKAVDILSDGIITLEEAIANGLNFQQAALLEMQHAAEEFAARVFRVAVMTERLNATTDTNLRSEALLQLAESEIEARQETNKLRIEMAKLFIQLSSGTSILASAGQKLLAAEAAFAQHALDTKIELVALLALLGQNGLAGQAGIFGHALADLGQEFRRSEESVLQFLNRLATASLQAAQQKFDELFNRPTKESAQIQLNLAELERQKLLLQQGGATDAELKDLNDRIDATKRLLDLRGKEEDIARLHATLADKTLLTDKDQLFAASLLIGLISQQSVIVDSLNTKLALEILASSGAAGALNDLADAARRVRSEISAGSGTQIYLTLPTGSPREAGQAVEDLLSRNMQTASYGGSRLSSGSFAP